MLQDTQGKGQGQVDIGGLGSQKKLGTRVGAGALMGSGGDVGQAWVHLGGVWRLAQDSEGGG